MTSDAMTYDLSYPRGPRGTATVVVATEPFSRSLRVTADPARQSKADIAPATRLSVLRQFGTIHEMTTAWCWADSGMPAKVVFASLDSSGAQSWNQLIWNPERIAQVMHSTRYGDRQRSLAPEHNGTTEDLLLLIAARLAWPRLRLGQNYSAPLLLSLGRSGTPEWGKAEFTLGKDRETVVVPAGSFRVYSTRVQWPYNRVLRIDVEADAPNRIIRWIDSAGEKAELTVPKPTA